MFLPEYKIEIKKIDLQNNLPTLKKLNPDFHKEFLEVFKSTKENLQYAYTIEFPYGFPIIKDGKMYFLEKDSSNEYEHQSKVELKDEFNKPKNSKNLWDAFVKDCKRNSDHPLAMVLSNNVEVFTEQESGAFTKGNSATNYRLPLNQISTGGLFGVWGTLDLILDSSGQQRADWYASAGKSCFQFLFPIPKKSKSNAFYQSSFNEVFGIHSEDLTEAIHSVVNKIDSAKHKTKILIFPEHYFVSVTGDTKKCRAEKTKLQNYLFGYGWKQFKKHRDLLWENKELMQKLGIRHNDYNFQMLNHLIDVLNGTAYVLKLVDSKDPILFKTFEHLCRTLNEKKPSVKKDKGLFANLLEYNTPFFFHYSTITEPDNQWAIIPYYAPAINTHIPKQKRANDFDTIFTQSINTKPVKNYIAAMSRMKKMNIEISAIKSQTTFEKSFCKEYLLAAVGPPPKNEDERKKVVYYKLSDLFKNTFSDIDTKIHLQENKDTMMFNAFILIKIS